MKSPLLFLVTTVLLLMSYDQPVESDSVSGGGGTIEAVNHTHWIINHFSTNGRSGVNIIGPWQGGDDTGCFGVSPKWGPGMTVEVEWETGEVSTDSFPGYDYWDEYLEWKKKQRQVVKNTVHQYSLLIVTARKPVVPKCTSFRATG